jgi:hypothetical protein
MILVHLDTVVAVKYLIFWFLCLFVIMVIPNNLWMLNMSEVKYIESRCCFLAGIFIRVLSFIVACQFSNISFWHNISFYLNAA